MPKFQRIAVDTNYILDLGLEDESALASLEILVERSLEARFVVTPTVVEELAWQHFHHPDEAMRELAMQAALRAQEQFGFTPIPMEAVRKGIAERIAESLRGPDLVPFQEKNDSLIWAEACLLDCDILVTNDRHLTGVEIALVQPLLEEYGTCPIPIWPKKIVMEFG
ncbi:MAG: type II toxin-antitoxin system VapC family toxin [Verrucomicrobiota bacterium]